MINVMDFRIPSYFWKLNKDMTNKENFFKKRPHLVDNQQFQIGSTTDKSSVTLEEFDHISINSSTVNNEGDCGDPVEVDVKLINPNRSFSSSDTTLVWSIDEFEGEDTISPISSWSDGVGDKRIEFVVGSLLISDSENVGLGLGESIVIVVVEWSQRLIGITDW